MDLPAQEVSAYLAQVRSWRLAVLEFIDGSSGKSLPGKDGLTERVRNVLATFLASAWTQQMTAYANKSPYNISAFPAETLEARVKPAVEAMFEVLRWRASVVDYLSDVWDVIGEPFLDIEECNTITEFLDPVGEAELCMFCLQVVSGKHDCMLTSHVRAKWPPIPPNFAKWAKEAGNEPSTRPKG